MSWTHRTVSEPSWVKDSIDRRAHVGDSAAVTLLFYGFPPNATARELMFYGLCRFEGTDIFDSWSTRSLDVGSDAWQPSPTS